MDKQNKSNIAPAAKATCEPAVIGNGRSAPNIASEDKITSQSVSITKKN